MTARGAFLLLGVLSGLAHAAEPVAPAAASNDFLGYLEWLFNTSLTEAQQIEATTVLAQVMERNDPDELRLVSRGAELVHDLANYPASEVDALRSSVEDEYLKTLRRRVGRLPLGRWILALRKATVKIVAAGPPKLSQQAVDALAEMLGPELTKSIVRAYPKVTREQRRVLADAPHAWARLRASWRRTAEAEREARRADWKASLQAVGADPVQSAQRAADVIAATQSP